MRRPINLTASAIPKAHAPAANNPAVITLPADSETFHVVDSVLWSYNADPTGGSLTITSTVDGTAVSQVITIVAKGQDQYCFSPPIQGDVNTAITITLAAGGAAVTGKINAMTR